ncbi:helix-turn-helix domain-containing protein [Rhizobium pusense]|uniref:HTH cro/C1-type domain-containing protein n=1 Tax=Agrobacterium genomosp. 2 str. CFBP 5494 TaxID=1183436 RepID=A0A9W5EX60_9HYPH|nr:MULTISPECIES: helix-turn-helix transcriptional regulator [Rhizobium/Agrobacterium group]MDH0908431.1 helix-turn-helix domain-containing protein [Agrobacterium pusense]MDH1094263.1 helix-turn-helix domain-containing protein [Agrobacterium pusense]MDH1110845.1 helix-turn-helix domain-containing protein [Agrobacterium pusense]MDH2192151.1 helix-turn-helix domain-containing protein [Agrobacterium pusense]CAD7043485.1 hypothetical protein RP007_01029 [Rhizobium sp. P007]
MSDTYTLFKRRFERRALARLIDEKYNSLYGFSRDIGVANYRVQDWFLNGKKPSPKTVVRICEVLRCSVDEIAPKLDAPALPNKKSEIYLGRARYFQTGRA